MIDSKTLYQCKHCMKKFSREPYFMAHECKEMLRSKEIQTMVGQQSYQLYKLWLEKQRRKAPTIEVFTTSTFYTSFYKFAVHSRAIGLSDHEAFVGLMITRGISPALWTRDEPYEEYIAYIDKKSDPYRQAELTLAELIKLAEKIDCPLPQIFENLKYGELLSLLTQRKLSPWVLFCSTAFKAKLTTFDADDRSLLMKTIGVAYWSHTFEQKPEIVKDLKLLVSEIGI